MGAESPEDIRRKFEKVLNWQKFHILTLKRCSTKYNISGFFFIVTIFFCRNVMCSSKSVRVVAFSNQSYLSAKCHITDLNKGLHDSVPKALTRIISYISLLSVQAKWWSPYQGATPTGLQYIHALKIAYSLNGRRSETKDLIAGSLHFSSHHVSQRGAVRRATVRRDVRHEGLFYFLVRLSFNCGLMQFSEHPSHTLLCSKHGVYWTPSRCSVSAVIT